MIRATMAQVGVDDRGFNYGDGLFETMLVADGEPVWWGAHYARLERGCDVLRIACPASDGLLAQAREFAAAVLGELVEPEPRRVGSRSSPRTGAVQNGEPMPRGEGSTGSPRTDTAEPTQPMARGDGSTGSPRTDTAGRSISRAALKLVVTRGAGGRGYAPSHTAAPTIVWSLHDAPAPQPDGIAVRWCDLRLSQQPMLAGIKHLNRLENVLARAEWDDPAIAEGLLRDAEGRVVCATAANLFVVRGGTLSTPSLHRCGVAGTTRAWVMARMPVVEADLVASDIQSADELFLTGSLRGILPVARLGGREWNVGPMTRRLQGLLHDEVPAL